MVWYGINKSLEPVPYCIADTELELKLKRNTVCLYVLGWYRYSTILVKVVEVSTSKTGKHGHAKCHFVAIDIFNGKKLEDIVPSSHNCDVPHVNRTDYQLIDISEDGFVSLLTESGGTKDDLKLPTDDTLLTQIKDGFAEGKDLVVTVMSAMGEEQICALKDIGPK
ncbi:putative ribosomal protein L2, domain 2 [Helianthus annuus]|nr:putative ribosomal protein L2, domain 2 [Helianthus annuus]